MSFERANEIYAELFRNAWLEAMLKDVRSFEETLFYYGFSYEPWLIEMYHMHGNGD